MKKSKCFRTLLVILGYLALGVVWLGYGVNSSRTFDIALGACFLGLALGRTFLLLRDLKDAPDLSEYADTGFQNNMDFGKDMNDN